MTLVSLHDVSVAYDGHEALQHVNLEIFDRDSLGIIGPNGGGKTTLVKAILGAIPYSGVIQYAPELFRGRERLIGYMPQIAHFDRAFPISVFEVVLSGLQGHHGFRSRYSRQDKLRAMELIAQSGLENVARHPIGEISGGQMQRALLARAIISEPRLLILDEPTNFVPRAEQPHGHRHGLARHRNHLQRRQADRLRQPTRTSAPLEHPYSRTTAQLRLPDSADHPRNHSAHRPGAPPRRLLLRPRIGPAVTVIRLYHWESPYYD